MEAYECGECLPRSLIDIIPLAKSFEVFTEYLTGQSPYKNEDEYSEYVSRQEVLVANLDRLPDQTSKEIVSLLNVLLRTILPEDAKSSRALRLLLPHFKAILEVCDEIHATYMFCLNSGSKDTEIANLWNDQMNESPENAVGAAETLMVYLSSHFGQLNTGLLDIRMGLDKLITEFEEGARALFKECSPASHDILGDDDESL